VLTLLRPGGPAAIDNVLLDGEVVEAAPEDPATRAIRAIRAIRALNTQLKNNDRTTISIMPLGDGPTLSKKQ
jgi:caffeoyl-CoA O-methyltransferase